MSMRGIYQFALFVAVSVSCLAVGQRPLLAADLQSECVAKGDGFVFASDECLEVKRVQYGDKKDAVLVFLHGYDRSPSSVFKSYGGLFDAIAKGFGGVAYMIASPGYGDSSTENFSQTKKDKNRHNPEYIKVYAEAVRAIQKREGAERVLLAGQSNGAMVAANLIGLHPGLVNGAALISGAYDLNNWYLSRRWSPYSSGTSPIEVAQHIQDTSILIVVGEDDRTTPKKYSEQYAKKLQELNVPHDLVIVPGARHSQKDAAKGEFLAAIVAFLNR